MCARLRNLLGQADFTAEQLWSAHRPELRTHFGEHFRAIDEAIRNYEFDVALGAFDDFAAAATPAPRGDETSGDVTRRTGA